MKKIFSLALIAVLLSSCMATKTPVGTYKESTGTPYVYAKGKQVWLFWGALPMGRTSVATPADGSCEIITKRNLVDNLIYLLTGGIVVTHTIKVKAKK